MKLLISTEQNSHFSVAIGQDEIDKVKVVKKPYRQSELLLRTIKELLESQNKKLEDLKGLIVVSGPGAFSALRIGVTTANALAYSLDVPVVGVEVLEEDKLDKVFEDGVLKLKGKKKFEMKAVVVPEYGREPNIS
ncbi:tRNA (adenosine(37)-N6)-threonylcarbamoyltransferase complex dimerization subunit type 1 TsaB [Candidatus Falkowbacteria bacterium]|nr:tRNA (adenosine(37)-N6)-threonylcarbamoyltransferase complex dimerization subunit type 1 TsaB [Candidatus Falkowbacteria bacterium]